MTLVSVTANHSFGGEVEASNTPTIRRLTPSCRHQLPRIALERVAVDVEGLHLGIANLDALLVGARVERTLDLQASLGRGRRNQLDDGQSVRQRSATPALRDMAEQAVLDLVPLRSTRRIVMDVDHKLRRIGELLQLDFPQPQRSIRAAAVGRDRQLAGM